MSVRLARYVIVTPVRDEENYLPRTIESVVGQEVRPADWVIVDDGSSDRTGEIIAQASQQHSWIRGVRRPDRGFRRPGAGIIEAFYCGYDALTCRDWEYMAKLDGDLSFAPSYFATALAKFDEDRQLGIGGGVLYHSENDVRVLERTPAFHVRGGAKIYRRACWEEIGGLWVGLGSDTLDEVKANMLGWTTMSFSDLHITHHRFTGATFGRWGGAVKDGKCDYVCGYHPLFMLAKCIRRMATRPYLIGGLATMYGFLTALWSRMPQVNDAALIRYLRREQMARITGRPTIWK